MFRWYANAAKCYVFLSDVSARKRDSTGSVQVWESAFRKSRWHQRGWTLQELLAPRLVDFYSREGELLGDKGTLEGIIHETTGIPTAALRGQRLSDFSAKERMQWASNRKTTRLEDSAYCLLGIFDVAMPLIYGEGDKAFIRLKDEIAKSFRRQLVGTGRDVVSNPCSSDPSNPGPTCIATDNMSPLDRRKTFMASLSFDQMDSRRSTIKTAYSTTCQWLLKHPAYVAWVDPKQLEQHRGFLWINGKPGAGKSTLVKFAYARASNEKPDHEVLLSFFFNARGEQLERSTIGMYRALLFQLLDSAVDLQDLLDDFGHPLTGRVDQVWTIEELCKLVTAAVRKLGKRRLKCFIDALDECDEQEVQQMITFFEDLGQNAVDSGTKIYICFVSRHFPIIEIRHGRQLILEDQDGHAQDLAKYVQRHLQAGKSNVVGEVSTEILRKANGVFLWVVLVVNILNKEFKNGRLFAVKKRLQEIPPGLSDLFKDILRRDCANLDEFLLCLQWVLFAKRPLRREEFYYAMVSGLEPESEEITVWDSDRITEDYMNRFVLTSSKGLAELTRSKTPTVQFIHESVRDFLVKDKGLYEVWPNLGEDLFSSAHDRLKRCCQVYLNVDISSHISPPNPSVKSVSAAKHFRHSLTTSFPFLEYASQHVLYHADEAATAFPQDTFLADFVLEDWVKTTNLFARYDTHRHSPNASLLYVLSANNFARLIRTVCDARPVMGPHGERYHYPLFAALANGHREAVRALLHFSEDAEIPISMDLDDKRRFREVFAARNVDTPLLWALRNEHNTIADKIIQSTDFLIHTSEAERYEAFLMAVTKGHEPTVRVLLAADDSKTDCYEHPHRTVLPRAASYGYDGIVRLLIDNGADIETVDTSTGLGALHAAVKHGRESTVQLLLNMGANPNVVIDRFKEPLLWCHNDDIVRMLLDCGANANVTDQAGETPLSYHSRRFGSTSILQLLLERGADIEHIDREWDTALLRAVRADLTSTTQFLLDNGANTEARDIRGRTALHNATASGRENSTSILLLLLGKGVNIHQIDDRGMTALHHAASGHLLASTASTLLLLGRGANIEARDFEGKTALHHAVSSSPTSDLNSTVLILLERGANIEAVDGNGRTAFELSRCEKDDAVEAALQVFADQRHLVFVAAQIDYQASRKICASLETAESDDSAIFEEIQQAESSATTVSSSGLEMQGTGGKYEQWESFVWPQEPDLDDLGSSRFQEADWEQDAPLDGFTVEQDTDTSSPGDDLSF